MHLSGVEPSGVLRTVGSWLKPISYLQLCSLQKCLVRTSLQSSRTVLDLAVGTATGIHESKKLHNELLSKERCLQRI